MSLLNKAMTYARSPQGRQTIQRVVASRTGGGTTSRGRVGGRRAPAPTGLAGVLQKVAGGAARGRRR
jgi:hypothetical protein